MTTFSIPTVVTDRLRLLAFNAEHLEAYAAMQANPNVMRYLLSGQPATSVQTWYTMLTSLGSWALRGYGMWACEETASARFIGSVGMFQPLDWPEPEVAYSLDEPFWHQGLATEAAMAARDWLFGNFPFARIASFIRPENHASIRVAKRLGAVCEGTTELRGVSFQHWVHHRLNEGSNASLRNTNAPAS